MQRETTEERWLGRASSHRQEVNTPQPANNTQKYDLFYILYIQISVMSLNEVLYKELWITVRYWNVIDSFSASDPGRIIRTVVINSVISTECVQKAASAPLLWAHDENCESDYRCGFCLYFKRLQQFHSVSDSDGKYLNKAQNCVIKYLHTHSLQRGSEQRDIYANFAGFIGRGAWGEQD